MNKSLKKAKYSALFNVFSIIGLFFRNKNITKRKLIYGTIIISLTAAAVSCKTYQRTCYVAQIEDDFPELNDTTQTK